MCPFTVLSYKDGIQHREQLEVVHCFQPTRPQQKMNQVAAFVSATLPLCHHINQSLPRLLDFSYSFFEHIRMYPGSVGMCKMESLSRSLFAEVLFVLLGLSVRRHNYRRPVLWKSERCYGTVHPKLLWAEFLCLKVCSKMSSLKKCRSVVGKQTSSPEARLN